MPQMLKSALTDILPEKELSNLYSSFDIIGTKIIIRIPDSLLQYKEIIGQTLIQKIKNIDGVFMQTSPVSGEFRIRNIECIAGNKETEVEYKEHGCRFKVDIRNAYFSPRLSSERLRIANLVKENEDIINMFGGVGTFSIVIAKKHRCKVINIDSNPIAIKYCQENAKINKLSDKIIPVIGNARDIIKKSYTNFADRILMPLPEQANEFVDMAVEALRSRKGVIHYFAHVKSNSKKESIVKSMEDTSKFFSNYRYNINHVQVVREVGPRIYQIVSDIDIL